MTTKQQLVELFDLPRRTEKPRERGLTMVIDNGMGESRVRALLEEGADCIDYIKLGWASALVTPELLAKVNQYQSAGVPVCLGGTFFELAHVKNRVNEYCAFARDLGITMLEVSDGSVEMERAEKLSYIETLAKDFRVLSEYGSKDGAVVHAPNKWVRNMVLELDAGAWKSVAEGRESGTAGLFRETMELRSGLVDEIVEVIEPDRLIWETPMKHQQVLFIQRFGANVNLGNIPHDSVIALESLRLGLRMDTLMHFHAHS